MLAPLAVQGARAASTGPRPHPVAGASLGRGQPRSDARGGGARTLHRAPAQPLRRRAPRRSSRLGPGERDGAPALPRGAAPPGGRPAAPGQRRGDVAGDRPHDPRAAGRRRVRARGRRQRRLLRTRPARRRDPRRGEQRGEPPPPGRPRPLSPPGGLLPRAPDARRSARRVPPRPRRRRPGDHRLRSWRQVPARGRRGPAARSVLVGAAGAGVVPHPLRGRGGRAGSPVRRRTDVPGRTARSLGAGTGADLRRDRGARPGAPRHRRRERSAAGPPPASSPRPWSS